jgi:c-di-GMP-specific phosphodiesterase
MTVVSEGVATIEQHVELAELGCDACRGFYFARPMPATSLESFLAGHGDGADLSLPPARPRVPPRKLSPPVSGPG